MSENKIMQDEIEKKNKTLNIMFITGLAAIILMAISYGILDKENAQLKQQVSELNSTGWMYLAAECSNESFTLTMNHLDIFRYNCINESCITELPGVDAPGKPIAIGMWIDLNSMNKTLLIGSKYVSYDNLNADEVMKGGVNDAE
jgi:hypothetical protein